MRNLALYNIVATTEARAISLLEIEKYLKWSTDNLIDLDTFLSIKLNDVIEIRHEPIFYNNDFISFDRTFIAQTFLRLDTFLNSIGKGLYCTSQLMTYYIDSKDVDEAIIMNFKKDFDTLDYSIVLIIKFQFMPHFAGKIEIVLKSIWDEILGSEFNYVKSLEPKIAKEFIKNKLLEIEHIRVVPSNLSPLRDACLTKEQKNYELLKNYFDDIDNNSEIDVLVNVILKSLKKVQGFGIHMPTNEKARTKFTAEFIQNFVAKDESGYGFSETLKTMGEIDILIEKIDGNSVAICEGFNLKNSLNKTVIKNHINKLFTYDVNGLKANFIIVYVETQNLQIFWEKYYTFIQTIVTPYNLIEIIQLSDTWPSLPTDIKLCKLTYLRNGLKIFVYHMFVHMR